jgi:pyruvate,water dikinase
MECEAIRFVREEMGFTNIKVMVPFCRTPEELKKVMAIMKTHGLERGKQQLEIYVMAELPSNIWLAEDFAELIDGFSIGSNDLTQLTLGLDRDSGLVAHLYDERNQAVKASIRYLINIAKAKGIKVGICGQGPSDFPDFSAFLVDLGIDSISVTPDALFNTMKTVREIEINTSTTIQIHA